jgi:c-di-GMP-binding flagellar brake protein YcgR
MADEQNENRRENYRCSFPEGSRLHVNLETPMGRKHLSGEIIDMSTTGATVRLDGTPALPLQSETVVASFHIPGVDSQLSVNSAVVHRDQGDDAVYLGLEFLPLAIPSAAETRDRILWSFLLNEQRRQRKEKLSRTNKSGARLSVFRPNQR